METLENTETITYQGEHIEAEKIGEIGGYMGTLLGRQRNGTDHLFRDAEGRYYLRRERFTALESGGHDYTHQARAVGAVVERTHAINVNAAILWAINLLGCDAFYLRRDAAELLMEGRSYFDPQPVHLSPERRASIANAGRLFGEPLGADAAATSDERNFAGLDGHVAGLLHAYMDAHPNEDSRDVINGFLACLLESELFDRSRSSKEAVADARRRRAAREQAGKQNAAPIRMVVELDEVASAMLRQVCEEGDECREVGESPRDLVNAAVTFYLACDNNSQQGEFDVSFGDEALERAKAARLGKERA